MSASLSDRVAFVMGAALATERIVEAFWASAEIAISGSNEKSLTELKTSVVFRNFQRGFSIAMAVCVGIGLGYASRAQDSAFTRNEALFMGALGGFLAPWGHGLVKILEETKEAYAKPIAMLAMSPAETSAAESAVVQPENVPPKPTPVRHAVPLVGFYSSLRWLGELFRGVAPVPSGDTRVPPAPEAALEQAGPEETSEQVQVDVI